MAKKIIFNGETGILSIMYQHQNFFFASLPSDWTEEEKLIHLADKDLPTGTGYEIVDDEILVWIENSEMRGNILLVMMKKNQQELSDEYKRKYMEITE